MKPYLFQFWDSPKPPTEVMVLMKTWESDDAFNYRRYDALTAEAYIAKHFDARTLNAFKRCAIPAMMADFFRYCALYIDSGVYVDADTKNSGTLPGLIEGNDRGVLMKRGERIANDFLYVQYAKDPMYKEVISDLVKNIENQISNNVWMVTGPGIMTHMFQKAEKRVLFNGFRFEPVEAVRSFVVFQQHLEYKTGDKDWRLNLGEGAKSIFLDVPPPPH